MRHARKRGSGNVTSQSVPLGERAEMRRAIRARRRAITTGQRAVADRAICRTIRALGAYRSARRLAVYLAFDGEPSLESLIRLACNQHKRLYAPVLQGSDMTFAPLRQTGRLRKNWFGIAEPERKDLIDPRKLDLVLTPLVAFDGNGHRLGVGRGYYDRCFAFLAHRRRWHRPMLLGVAYSMQEVAEIVPATWDVRLSGVVTEQGIQRF
jgi:5-formyltetrahydrofolate cyclo-ligase